MPQTVIDVYSRLLIQQSKPIMQYNEYYGGIGDPTIIGWIITIAYFIAAFFCWRAAKVEIKNNFYNRNFINDFIWVGLSVLLILLGINKQLDFQTFFISKGRDIALTHGWYTIRSEVQELFIGFMGLMGLVSMIIFIWQTWDRIKEFQMIILGLVLLISFVLIRAASFNNVDYFLSKWRVIGPFKMKYVVELGGIIFITLGTILKLRRNYYGRDSQ